MCSATVMLGGELAADEPNEVPGTAAQWLASHGWIHRSSIWFCGNHRTET